MAADFSFPPGARVFHSLAIGVAVFTSAGCSSHINRENPPPQSLVAVAVMENTETNVSAAFRCLAECGIEAISDGSVLAWIVVPAQDAERASQALLRARAARGLGSAWFLTPEEFRSRSKAHRRAVQEYLSAKVSLSNEKLEAALACLDRAVGLDPGWPDPYWLRALVHYLRGEIGEALEDYDEVRDSPPLGTLGVEPIRDLLERVRDDR